jgi:hypothetical protein
VPQDTGRQFVEDAEDGVGGEARALGDDQKQVWRTPPSLV